MKDRLDPLISERAPWLLRDRLAARTARMALDHLLRYRRTVALAEEMRDWPAPRIMDRMAHDLARTVEVAGLHRLPDHGPALIVANHPTGIADGVMLWHALAARRPDLYFFANSDILRVLPQMRALIAPVEWRKDRRCHAKSRETLAYVRRATAEGRIGVLFPSGRLAKRRGLSLHERPWMASAAMIARKLDMPVLPIHIRARNSALFYAFDLMHPTLRDITLFHETLNKARQPYRITLGRPIVPRDLPEDAENAIAHLRAAVLRLGDTRFGPRPVLPKGPALAR